MDTTSILNGNSKTPEMQLVEMAKQGDRFAFDELFQAHKPFIYNVCYRVLGVRDDAIDATQVSFIQAYNSLKSFRGGCAFRSWLYRIAVNTCTSMLRREKRRNVLSLDIDVPDESKPSDDRVGEAILELPVHLRVVLVLFYYQELSCEQIAESLGCSVGAVKTRLHRARVAFKSKYEDIER